MTITKLCNELTDLTGTHTNVVENSDVKNCILQALQQAEALLQIMCSCLSY